MESLNFQEVIPLGFWAFSSATGLMVIIIAMFLYLYYRKRLRAIIDDGSSEADLAGRVEQLRKDEENIRSWLAAQKDELQSVAAERRDQEMLRAELQRMEQECTRDEEFNRTLRNEVGQLENNKHTLAEKCLKLEREKSDSENNIEQLKSQKEELNKSIEHSVSESAEHEKACYQLDKLHDQKNTELRELEQEARETKKEVDSLRFENEALRKNIDSLKEREQEVEILNQKLLILKHDLDETRNEATVQQRNEDVAARKTKNCYEEMKILEGKKEIIERQIVDLYEYIKKQKQVFDDIERQVVEINKKRGDKQVELTEAEKSLDEKLSLKSKVEFQIQNNLGKIDKLKTEETTLQASIATLKVLAKKYNKSLDIDGEVNNDSKYRDLWQPIIFPALRPTKQTPEEQTLLQKTSDYIKTQGLYFPERVLHAFHTALKVNDISPLVVLAGISGTGKSELPRRYAEGMGMHSVILAVQPRWDSPQDLFGFYNYLEQRYKATELARAMVQFELFNKPQWPLPEGWKHDRSDRMLLVLLDEMNLARVEYYFSEFLSRLETRRGIDLSVPEERAKAEIALEMGSLAKGEKPIKLFPGQNVLFSGTMNEDETTQALSDKVLDRSCVLRFGRPKQIKVHEQVQAIHPTTTGLTFKQWKTFLKDDLPAEEKDRVNGWINKLNTAMEQLNRPFGHRAALAIQKYIANYPSWIPNRVNLAMADQIEQRIMPKLRGIEIGEVEQPLREILSVIKECEDKSLAEAFEQGAQSEQQVFIWRGLDRTEEFY